MSSSINSFRGTVDEITITWLINGEKWLDSRIKSSFVDAKRHLTRKQILVEQEHAKLQVTAFLKEAAKLGYRNPIRAYWIGKFRDQVIRKIDPDHKMKLNLDPKHYPADILVEFRTGPQGAWEKWLGLSAKSSTRISSNKLTFKNVGIKSMEADLHVDISPIDDAAQEEFAIEHSLSQYKEKRRSEIRKNLTLIKEADEAGNKVLDEVRDVIFRGFEELSPKDAYHLIMNKFLNANDKMFPSYLKVSAYNDEPPYKIHVENPQKNSIYADFRRGPIRFEKGGQQSINVFANNKKAFSILVKYDQQKMAGTIKFGLQ